MRCAIVGAGGHGRVVLEILKLNKVDVVGFYDDNKEMHGKSVSGVVVKGNVDDIKEKNVIVAITDPKIRKKLVKRCLDNNLKVIGCRHPRAYVSSTAKIGGGVQLCVGCVVNPDAVIGDHTILNTNAVVEHDCKIGNYCHLAPNATVIGFGEVGDMSMVGAGAVVLKKKVGKDVVVGAGAVITKDTEDGKTYIGIPAGVKDE